MDYRRLEHSGFGAFWGGECYVEIKTENQSEISHSKHFRNNNKYVESSGFCLITCLVKTA